MTCDSDDFNRADNSSSMGTSAGGRTWTPRSHGSGGDPTIGIDSNQAYFSASAVGGKAAIDFTDTSDVEVRAIIGGSLSGFGGGLFVRGNPSDPEQEYSVFWGSVDGKLYVVRGDPGGGGTPLQDQSVSFSSGDELKVRVVGDLMTVYINGSPVTGYVDLTLSSSYSGFTEVGLYQEQGTAVRWDDFEVCPVVTSTWYVGMIKR